MYCDKVHSCANISFVGKKIKNLLKMLKIIIVARWKILFWYDRYILKLFVFETNMLLPFFLLFSVFIAGVAHFVFEA